MNAQSPEQTNMDDAKDLRLRAERLIESGRALMKEGTTLLREASRYREAADILDPQDRIALLHKKSRVRRHSKYTSLIDYLRVNGPMTRAELIAAAATLGIAVTNNAISMRLHDLAENGVVARVDGKWLAEES